MIQFIDQLIAAGEYQAASILINKAITQQVNLGGRHITYANALLLNSDWSSLTSIMPQDTNFFLTSGWLNSLRHQRPVNKDNQPIPWLTYPAIDYIDTVIKSDWRIFEWGSGNSTLWWAAKTTSVVAVEDNSEWFNEIKSQMPSNVSLKNITEKSAYVDEILAYEDNSFDVIVIDGSHRNECARAAIPKLKHTGMLIFDNSDGAEYDESMIFLNSNGFFRNDFWGLIPSYLYKNCTSIFYRENSLLKDLPPPSRHVSSVGISCFQAMENTKLA
jgi:hypothetical protein